MIANNGSIGSHKMKMDCFTPLLRVIIYPTPHTTLLSSHTILSFSQNVSISVTSQRLNNLLSQLNSINDSIEQIKIQANQSRTVDLNLPASLDIDIFSGCIVERQQPCQTTIFGYCLTLTNYFENVS